MSFSANEAKVIPNWKVRGTASINLLINMATKYGLSARDCLQDSTISSFENLDDPFVEVEATQELIVVENLRKHLSHIPGIGLEAGQQYQITRFGILGYGMISSRSLGSAIDFAVRHLDLTFALTRYRTESTNGGMSIILDDRDVPQECRQFVVERDAASTIAILRQVLTKPFPVLRATFCFEEPPYASLFEEFFQGPVTFGGTANELVISNEWLEQTLPLANEQTSRMCEAQCKEELDRHPVQLNISNQVRQRLLQPGKAATQMDTLASEMGMTTRTLRRHLVAEGSTYRQILEGVREMLALEMLGNGMKLEEIANRLGYSDASNFTRAFKSWKGVCPNTYRQKQQLPLQDTSPPIEM